MSEGGNIIGLERIAEKFDRDKSTIRRWIAKGILEVWRSGPFPNSPLATKADHIDRLRRQFEGDDDT